MKFPIERIVRYTSDDGVHVKCEEVGDLVRCKDCEYSQPMWSGGHPEDKAIEYYCSELGLWRMHERNNGYCYWGKGEKMYLIDTRKYDDSFLLAKILEKVDFSDEEKKKLFKHFEKPEAVDAVPVVRCKDCFYSWPFDEEELKEPYRVGEWHCEFWYGEMHEDDYCSCGKRRPDEAD